MVLRFDQRRKLNGKLTQMYVSNVIANVHLKKNEKGHCTQKEAMNFLNKCAEKEPTVL